MSLFTTAVTPADTADAQQILHSVCLVDYTTFQNRCVVMSNSFYWSFVNFWRLLRCIGIVNFTNVSILRMLYCTYGVNKVGLEFGISVSHKERAAANTIYYKGKFVRVRSHQTSKPKQPLLRSLGFELMIFFGTNSSYLLMSLFHRLVHFYPREMYKQTF